MLPVVAVVWFAGPLLGVGYPIAVALSVIATFVLVNLVLASMLSPYERKAERFRDVLAPLAIAVLLTMLEFVLASLHEAGAARHLPVGDRAAAQLGADVRPSGYASNERMFEGRTP